LLQVASPDTVANMPDTLARMPVPASSSHSKTWLGLLRPWLGSPETAVSSGGLRWSGDDLMRHAAGAADWLDAIGAPQGRPVPALAVSSPASFALIIGAAATGRPLAPLGPRHTARELAACLTTLGSPIVVTDPEWEGVGREAASACGATVRVIPQPSTSQRRLDLDPPASSVAFILHTSGTTGVPKAVPYRQDRMARRAEICGRLAALAPGSSFATASPFHHIAGWGNYAYALARQTAVVPVARFTVDTWVALASENPTNVLLVPTMIETLLDEGLLDAVSLRVLHYGAAPMHPDTLARVLDTLPGVGLLNIYGQTEGSPITVLTQEDHLLARGGRPDLLESVGRAVAALDLRIHEPDEAGVGEVHARGFHLMKPDPDGWQRTGDLGRLDRDGFLYLSGRLGDKIVRGGENVHPLEVEQVLCTHPSVRECAVVGVADRKWGQQVKAFVVPADLSVPLDFDELRAWAREQLSGFKVPTQWAQVDELPRNPSGKVLRRVLLQT
jgi:acyl-CoA synthetase (AMP-forming)/AMP-acid ligase II